MIFTKEYASSIDENVEVLFREYNIYYRDFVVSLMYLLSTRVYLRFLVLKLAKFSSYTSKLHFEGLVHLLRYIRDNKNLGLKYYSKIEDAPLPGLYWQTRIKIEK